MTTWQCSLCEYSSDNKNHIQRHINKLKKCGPGQAEILEIATEVKCEHCQKLFTADRNLKQHIKNNCKVVKSQEILKRHQKDNCKVIKSEASKVGGLPIFEFDEDDMNFIYILKEREFMKTKEHVFKMGFTTRDILARTNGYSKGSKIYCCLPVAGNPELKLIK